MSTSTSSSFANPFHFGGSTMRTSASRRFILLALAVGCLITLFYLGSIRHSGGGVRSTLPLANVPGHQTTSVGVDLKGHVIAPKLGNETVKAELGNAAWKLLHTTFARFPDKPATDEQEALHQFIHLFQRLYPCGECAEHFGTLLDKYPPQVSSRSAAAAWGCHVHNEVNKRLKKETFDCSKIGDFYDCGCAGDDETDAKKADTTTTKEADDRGHGDTEKTPRKPQLELERDGWTRGG